MRYKSAAEIDSYIKASNVFVEYDRFEDDAKVRAATKHDFMEGIVYAPHYEYPKLDTLFDADEQGNFLEDEKREAYEAVLDLEANKDAGILSPAELELYASFHEQRLKKMMLVEAASRMRRAGSSSEQQVARSEFMALNREVYGEMDETAFESIMATEQARVAHFEPADERAHAIKQSLEAYFIVHQYEGRERPPLDDDTMRRLQETIAERYGEMLSVVPDTDDTVLYDADQCRAILEQALTRSGLAAKGWAIEIDPAKSNPATNVDEKRIYLPTDTRRTADQLRRLIIHEIGVHAQRGQNGAESGVAMLEKGTAHYADVEEGLGVLLECVVAGNFDNQSYHRARDRYLTAGIALGLDGNPKDGRATFGLVWRLLALRLAEDGVVTQEIEREAKVLAMQHTENAFRGTNFAMPGIIYTKLKVYYEGLMQNADYFSEHRDNLPAALDQALLGKYDHVDPKEVREVRSLIDEKQRHVAV